MTELKRIIVYSTLLATFHWKVPFIAFKLIFLLDTVVVSEILQKPTYYLKYR